MRRLGAHSTFAYLLFPFALILPTRLAVLARTPAILRDTLRVKAVMEASSRPKTKLR